jgi:hypothetical protein
MGAPMMSRTLTIRLSGDPADMQTALARLQTILAEGLFEDGAVILRGACECAKGVPRSTPTLCSGSQVVGDAEWSVAP